MQVLLRDLASFSGLRDCNKLDFALVKLITKCGLWCIRAIQLLCAVRPLKDQHWMTCARLDDKQTISERGLAGSDWRSLSKLGGYPKRKTTPGS